MLTIIEVRDGVISAIASSNKQLVQDGIFIVDVDEQSLDPVRVVQWQGPEDIVAISSELGKQLVQLMESEHV